MFFSLMHCLYKFMPLFKKILIYRSVSLSQSLYYNNCREFLSRNEYGVLRMGRGMKNENLGVHNWLSSSPGSTEVLSNKQVIVLWHHMPRNVLNLSYCSLRSINCMQSSQANETLKWQSYLKFGVPLFIQTLGLCQYFMEVCRKMTIYDSEE